MAQPVSFKDRALATLATIENTASSALKTAEVDVKIINLATKVFELLKLVGAIAPNAGVAFLIHAEPFAKIGEVFNSLPGTFGALKRSNDQDSWYAWVCSKSFAIVDVISVNTFLDDMGVPSLSLIVDKLGQMPVLGEIIASVEAFPVISTLLFLGNSSSVIDNVRNSEEKRNKEALYGLVRDRWARKLAHLDASPSDASRAEQQDKSENELITKHLAEVRGLSPSEREEIQQLVNTSWDKVFGLADESRVKQAEKKAYCENQKKRWTVLTNEAWKSRAEGKTTIFVSSLRVVGLACKFFAIGSGTPLLLGFGIFVNSLALAKTVVFKHYYNASHPDFKMPKEGIMKPVFVAA